MRSTYLPTDGDFDRVFRVFDGVDDFFPRGQIGLLYVELELLGDNCVDALVVQHFGDFVNAFGVVAADHGALFHVAKEGDFAAFVFGQDSVHAADEHVGLDADFAQFFYGMLGRLGFDFACGGDVGHIAQVHKQGIAAAELAAHLADGFEEG